MATPTTAEDNPRKRGRTACTRCKMRKKRCDNQWPTCVNCEKAGLECDIADVRDEEGIPLEYLSTLEDRVAQLEIENAHLKAAAETTEGRQPCGLADSNNGSRHSREKCGVESGNPQDAGQVQHQDTANSSLAANLSELVQATVWNKTLSGANLGEQKDAASLVTPGQPANGVPITHRELQAHRAVMPDDTESNWMITAYLSMLHVRYPFIDEGSLWKLHQDRTRLLESEGNHLSIPERFGIFKLYMVYAIGSTLLQLTKKSAIFAPESFYMTALQHVSAAREARSMNNIEAMTLLVLYHLRSSSSHGMWYMIGLAMRTCIDLDLHREPAVGAFDQHEVQLRRRLFWSVYSLDRVTSISLGRPFSITDRQIDVKLPNESCNAPTSRENVGPVHHHYSSRLPPRVARRRTASATRSRPNVSIDRGEGSSHPTESAVHPPADICQAVDLIRLRRIESHICHSVYRLDLSRFSLLGKLPPLADKLEEWKASLNSKYAPGAPLDYLILHYHRAVRFLIEPFLPLLAPDNIHYQRCLHSAGEICQSHKRLHQKTNYGHSFIAVQTVFVAGITMLHCLWTHPRHTWSGRLAEDIRACSSVLFVMSERAPWVEKHRDAFELLVSAAMNRVIDGSLSNHGAGIVEHAAQAARANAPNTRVRNDAFGHRNRVYDSHSVISPTSNRSPATRHRIPNSLEQTCFPPNPVAEIENPGHVPPTELFPYSNSSTNGSHDTQAPLEFLFDDGAAYADPGIAPIRNDAMRIVNELAQWIEQDQESGLPVWMPTFGHLESDGRDLA